MGTTTISVSDETLERFRELKRAYNQLDDDIPDHNADSFLGTMMDTWENVGEIPDDGPEQITDALGDDEVAIVGTQAAAVDELAARLSGSSPELAEKLDRIEDAATTAEARTGSIENTLEGLQR